MQGQWSIWHGCMSLTSNSPVPHHTTYITLAVVMDNNIELDHNWMQWHMQLYHIEHDRTCMPCFCIFFILSSVHPLSIFTTKFFLITGTY